MVARSLDEPAGFAALSLPLLPSIAILHHRAILVVYFSEGVDTTGIPKAVIELSGSRRQECRDFIALSAKELASHSGLYCVYRS